MRDGLRVEIVCLLRRKIVPGEYEAIREFWIARSLADDRCAIPGLMATLTEDCLNPVVNSDSNWHRKKDVNRFYHQYFTSFPDIHFDLQYIIIRPQGFLKKLSLLPLNRNSGWTFHHQMPSALRSRSQLCFRGTVTNNYVKVSRSISI